MVATKLARTGKENPVEGTVKARGGCGTRGLSIPDSATPTKNKAGGIRNENKSRSDSREDDDDQSNHQLTSFPPQSVQGREKEEERGNESFHGLSDHKPPETRSDTDVMAMVFQRLDNFEVKVSDLEMKNSDLEMRVSGVTEELHHERSESSNLRGQVSKLEEQVSDYKGQVSDYKGQVSDYKGQVSNLEEQVSNYKGQVSNLEEQVSDYKGQVSNLEEQVSDYKGQVSNLEEQVSDYKGQVSTLEMRVSAVTEELHHERSESWSLRGQVSNLEAQVSEYKGQVSNLEEQVSKYQVQVDALQADSCYFRGLSSDLQLQVSNLKEQVSGCQAQVDALQADSCYFRGLSSDLQMQVSNLTEQVSAYHEQVCMMTPKVDYLWHLQKWTTGRELAVIFDKAMVRLYKEKYPKLKECKKSMFSDCLQFLNLGENWSLVQQGDTRKPGFQLNRMSDYNLKLGVIKSTRNTLNHQQYKGHRTAAVNKVMKLVMEATAPEYRFGAQLELEEIKSKVVLSPRHQTEDQFKY
ncbi:MAG: hypothetical protein SGBAC_010269 [Bacillariaceae sp.]